MLLIHILSNPGAATAQSDLVLMSIGSGFAHRLNFETGGAFNWPFIEEWAASASAAVHRARPSDAGLSAQIREPCTAAMASSGTGVGAEGQSNTPNLDENQSFQEVCPITYSYNVQILQPFHAHALERAGAMIKTIGRLIFAFTGSCSTRHSKVI